MRPVSGSCRGSQPGHHRAGQLAGLVLQKLLDGGLVGPWVFAKAGDALHLAVVHLAYPGPFGPGVGRGALGRRLGHHLKGQQIGAALAQRGALAVVAGVAAADHQYVFARGGDGPAVGQVRIQQTAGDAGQIVHREKDPGGIAARNVEIPGLFGPAAQHHCVVVGQHLGGVHRAAHVHTGEELHSLLLHDPTRRSTTDLSSFILGMPYIRRPPGRSSRS